MGDVVRMSDYDRRPWCEPERLAEPAVIVLLPTPRLLEAARDLAEMLRETIPDDCRT